MVTTSQRMVVQIGDRSEGILTSAFLNDEFWGAFVEHINARMSVFSDMLHTVAPHDVGAVASLQASRSSLNGLLEDMDSRRETARQASQV